MVEHQYVQDKLHEYFHTSTNYGGSHNFIRNHCCRKIKRFLGIWVTFQEKNLRTVSEKASQGSANRDFRRRASDKTQPVSVQLATIGKNTTLATKLLMRCRKNMGNKDYKETTQLLHFK